MFKWLSSALSALALKVGIASVNSACLTYNYQPKVPAEMDEYKK